MNEEDAFIAAINADWRRAKNNGSADITLLLVFADFLKDRNDPCEEGVRAIAACGIRTYSDREAHYWFQQPTYKQNKRWGGKKARPDPESDVPRGWFAGMVKYIESLPSPQSEENRVIAPDELELRTIHSSLSGAITCAAMGWLQCSPRSRKAFWKKVAAAATNGG